MNWKPVRDHTVEWPWRQRGLRRSIGVKTILLERRRLKVFYAGPYVTAWIEKEATR